MKNILKVIDVSSKISEKNKINLTIHQFAESLGNAIDAKDHYTCSHSEEVAVVSQAIGVQMGLDNERCELIHIAGHLHDIGKIGIPDSILKKTGRLTIEEYEIIKKHPEMGAQIVAPMASASGLNIIADTILHHHERYDGNGYPHGLKGKAIPLEARIIAVADTLSAMARDRPYRKAMLFSEIVAEIADCAGSQFDPMVVKEFLKIVDWIESYYRCGKLASDDFMLSGVDTELQSLSI